MSVIDLPGNAGISNESTQDQTINAATTALLVGSTLAVPIGKLRVGTCIRWTLSLSKTAAGTAANNFIFQLGTTGTVSDADIITFSTPLGTAVADTGTIELVVIIRGPLSALCQAQGAFWMEHNLATTGLLVQQVNIQNILSGTFDATTGNLIASLVCTTAASTVLTFQQVAAEMWNI